MFRQYTTSVSATPGHIASRGTISMYCRPSRLSMVPQLGTSGGSPFSGRCPYIDFVVRCTSPLRWGFSPLAAVCGGLAMGYPPFRHSIPRARVER